MPILNGVEATKFVKEFYPKIKAGEQDGVDASYDVNQAHFVDFTEVIVF